MAELVDAVQNVVQVPANLRTLEFGDPPQTLESLVVRKARYVRTSASKQRIGKAAQAYSVRAKKQRPSPAELLDINYQAGDSVNWAPAMRMFLTKLLDWLNRPANEKAYFAGSGKKSNAWEESDAKLIEAAMGLWSARQSATDTTNTRLETSEQAAYFDAPEVLTKEVLHPTSEFHDIQHHLPDPQRTSFLVPTAPATEIAHTHPMRPIVPLHPHPATFRPLKHTHAAAVVVSEPESHGHQHHPHAQAHARHRFQIPTIAGGHKYRDAVQPIAYPPIPSAGPSQAANDEPEPQARNTDDDIPQPYPTIPSPAQMARAGQHYDPGVQTHTGLSTSQVPRNNSHGRPMARLTQHLRSLFLADPSLFGEHELGINHDFSVCTSLELVQLADKALLSMKQRRHRHDTEQR